ncbi:MAG: aldo/keto reductase, partial [Armatimonadetes bacterium]|nr:aldo/keto reductase [Armatimonadota bacterium]
YGDLGSRKYLIASCDQSLKRMGLEYFDIFYHHRPDPETPLEETMAALDHLVRQGKALYAGVSNYGGAQFADAVRVCERMGLAPITIHQPYYNMLSRGIEWDLLPQTEAAGTGAIVFCPLASGVLTDKYLGGDVPAESRAAQKWGKEWVARNLSPERRAMLQTLNEMAKGRGQTLAQMALAWILRLPGITSALTGSSNVRQVEENVAALKGLEFSKEELQKIDELTMPRPGDD